MGLKSKFIILGVAAIWDRRKGLDDFVKIAERIGRQYQIILVGVTDEQIKKIPNSIIGIKRTNSVNELRELYAIADLFINPTYEDNFPTTNLEALACGTYVITYNTGGSPEAIDSNTGVVFKQGDVDSVIEFIDNFSKIENYKECIEKSKEYNKCNKTNQYIKIY